MSFRGFFESAQKKRRKKVKPPVSESTTIVPNGPLIKTVVKSEPRHHGKKRKFQPVSQAALQLSDRLKNLSRQKRLDEVLQLYWQSADDRDSYHACMVIDCCARCGDVAEAERVFKSIEHPSIELHTVLLKAFAQAGQVFKADELFMNICASHSGVVPNVRTLNTLLRGCLWTAASLDSETIAGGVVTSERAWKIYCDKVGRETLDASSYEYSITLLCQALCLQEARERIEEFMKRNKIILKGNASFRGGDQTSLETLAVVHLALARAYALLSQAGDTLLACQRVLNAVEGTKAAQAAESKSIGQDLVTRRKQTSGGKRSWKNRNDDSSSRLDSNVTFRSHRLTEIEMEARKIIGLRDDVTRSKSTLSQKLLTRIFYFSGGGTTEIASNEQNEIADRQHEDLQRRQLVPIWYSYGLASLMPNGASGMPDRKLICKQVGLDKKQRRLLSKDGRLDLTRLFLDSGSPIDIELGCGFGEWIAQQAKTNRDRNYIAVELRADRVSQIFTKGALELQLDNLCTVGSDCAAFLRNHMPHSKISTVFVNHPEPPTQTLGDNENDLKAVMNGGTEPAHMLNSLTLIAVTDCLQTDGKMVIVSDNRWYAKLVCATLVAVIRRNKCSLKSLTTKEATVSGLRVVESFGDGVTLYEKTPGRSGNNDEGGKTWFDRLWQTGTGRHAERSTRFVIIMHKRV